MSNQHRDFLLGNYLMQLEILHIERVLKNSISGSKPSLQMTTAQPQPLDSSFRWNDREGGCSHFSQVHTRLHCKGFFIPDSHQREG